MAGLCVWGWLPCLFEGGSGCAGLAALGRVGLVIMLAAVLRGGLIMVSETGISFEVAFQVDCS